MKMRMCISVSEETKQQIEKIAKINHVSSSQQITNWAWYGPTMSSNGMVKQQLLLYVSTDTHERLLQYCWENHVEPEKAVTEWIWKLKVKNDQIRGQYSLSDLVP